MKAVVMSSKGEMIDFEFGTSVKSLTAWFNECFGGMSGVSCLVYGEDGEQVLELCM